MSTVFAAAAAPAVIAHQGGWDEALLIGTPILAIGGLLWLAKRRVEAAHATSQETSPDAGSDVNEHDHRHV